MADHPMQPLEFVDPEAPERSSFKPNKIVDFLLKFSRGKGVGLNELGDMPWAQEDWDQFYQLIGMSVSGYSDCMLVSDEAKDKADAEHRRLTKTHLPGCGTDARGCVEGCWNYDLHFDGN